MPTVFRRGLVGAMMGEPSLAINFVFLSSASLSVLPYVRCFFAVLPPCRAPFLTVVVCGLV